METTLGPRTPVALYARVSTDEQREGQNIDSQVVELRRFAEGMSWPVVALYRDDGWSGSLLARPALDQLRDDASKGMFRAVLVNDVDRLARDVSHLGIIKRDLERQGVQVVFKKLPTDSSPTRNLMINVLGSFAEFERELIADRTRRGRRHKVEVRKEFVGSRPPYGFRYVKQDRAAGIAGHLELNEEEAIVVRQMFAWVDEDGLSARKVVERLNLGGARPRKGGQFWRKSSVLRVLRSQTYAGTWHYCKFEACIPKRAPSGNKYHRELKSSRRQRARDAWIPLDLPSSLHLISKDRWNRVQRQLDRNISFSPRNSRHRYLLRGLIRCGACGARYVGQPSHGRFYYRCLTRCKKLKQIAEAELNSVVWNAVSQAILNPRLITSQLPHLHKTASAKRSDRNSDVALGEQAGARIDDEEGRVLDAYRQRLLTPAQLKTQLEGIARRRAALPRPSRVVDRPNSDPSATVRSVEDYCRLAARRLGSFTEEERQRFLQLLIREIIFEGTRIRIKGTVSFNEEERDRVGTEDRTGPMPAGSIASATICEVGRNRTGIGAIADSTGYQRGRNFTAAEEQVEFEIVGSISPSGHARTSPKSPTSIMM